MPSEAWAASQRAFDEAAEWFATLAVTGPGHWDRPALGEWTVLDLVGHTSRALLTVEAYLDTPPAGPGAEVRSPVDYFRRMRASSGDAAAVAQRGRAAAAALGEDVPGAVRVLSDRVRARISGAAADALVATPVGGMRLSDYLPTRTFELTVHTCDLAVAVGQEVQVPAACAVESLSLIAQLAAGSGMAGPLLRAATGREGLPVGFSVL
jgi:Mycothiol maleylpyruvate isomerase N-terminal domain